MFALSKVASRALVQTRNLHVVANPPIYRVGVAHKIVHGVILFGAMLSVPIYVSVNFKNYREAPPAE